MTKRPLIGILGVGHLIRHMVPGLFRSPNPPRLLLSPRGATTAGELSRRFGLEIASDNRALVERADMVLLAVRPQQVEAALTGLPWRPGQRLVSFVASTSTETLARLAPGCRIIRAMPVTSGEFGESPTTVLPDDAEVRRLLEPAGPVIPLAAESDFEAASVIACYYGWVQALIGEVTAWLQTEGIEAETARKLVAAMTRAGATTVLERPQDPLDSLVRELCLPGSFTGQGLDVLRGRKAFTPWHEACRALLDRMRLEAGS